MYPCHLLDYLTLVLTKQRGRGWLLIMIFVHVKLKFYSYSYDEVGNILTKETEHGNYTYGGEQILDFLVKQSEDPFILSILMQMFSSVFLCALCKYA